MVNGRLEKLRLSIEKLFPSIARVVLPDNVYLGLSLSLIRLALVKRVFINFRFIKQGNTFEHVLEELLLLYSSIGSSLSLS